METKTSLTTSSINRSPLRYGFLLSALAVVLVCFAVSPTARAVDPPPDGGYPNCNTAEGTDALFRLDTSQGVNNTAIGFDALFSNTTGDANTATGSAALSQNIDGFQNTATGSFALQFNTTGWNNTATGNQTLLNNTTGNDNTATGAFALFRNTGGFKNTADGDIALFDNTTGSNNIALGLNAGINLTTGSNNIYIGNVGASSGESARVRIGTQGTQTATYIAGISGAPLAHGAAVPVGVTTDGQLGVKASSARFKSEIKSMDKASEAILALKPVTFHYKKDLDPKGTPQFGLVAEEVAKVSPDLVVCDADSRPFTVRYDEVNAMLLNEFLKEHRKVEQLEKQVEELTAGLQKVSAQLEASKPAPQVVNNL